uniref:Uncharacterized protein n=1 Tax=Rhizophora mucronata TaxID=61149 RepID=A0A2P2J1N0_RHIMU
MAIQNMHFSPRNHCCHKCLHLNNHGGHVGGEICAQCKGYSLVEKALKIV